MLLRAGSKADRALRIHPESELGASDKGLITPEIVRPW